MVVVPIATGTYNYLFSVFTEINKTDRTSALSFAQGYFAARNLAQEQENHVNLQKRWQELNAFVIRFCTDKTDEYLSRRLVNDAVETAFEQMKRR
jgi:hypothetical protein